MSKSNRRNYRNKSESDEETTNFRCSTQNNTKCDTTNKVTLSFGDELDDFETFKEKKSTQSKKLIVKTKEQRRKVVKANVNQHNNELDIYVQNNVIINVKPISPPKPIIICDDYYDDSHENMVTSIIQKGDIPDAVAIDRAKKQRELAKQRLETERSSSEDEDSKSFINNRLTSYSIQIDANTDENKRISMSINANASERERQFLRDRFLSVEQGSDKDSDQENEWQTRQLKHAMNLNVHQPKDTKKIDWQRHMTEDEEAYPQSVVLNDLHSISLEDISVATLSDLFKQRKAEIIQSREKNQSDIYAKERGLINNEEKANIAIKEIPMLEAKFNCFNNFTRFLNILVQCFDEKMEKIVYLEKKFIKIHKERTDKLTKRRRQDIQDQFDEIILKIKTSAIQSTFEVTNRITRISEKESRHLRRIRARETQNIVNHYDGLSSDDDEPKSTVSSRQNEIDQIQSDTVQLFSDTDPEYCTIEKILDRFIIVKNQFTEEYKDAFINGFLPHVLNPLIRVELTTWNPLCVPHFHKWNWFKILLQFTKDSVGTKLIKDDSLKFGDLKIIPTIIDKVVVPRLIEWVSVWNPLSKSETQSLVKLIHKLVSQIPIFSNKSVHVRNLLRAIACRVNECVCEDVSLPLYIEQYKENPNGPAFTFFQQHLWSLIKVFTNIMMLHDILDCSLVCKLAIEGVLNNYIITGLMILSDMGYVTDIIGKANMIKHSFPEHWFMQAHDNGVTPDIVEELSGFIRFINTFGYNHRKDKAALSFAFTSLDYFNVGRGELVAMMTD